MAIQIIDRRTVLTEADSLTNWTNVTQNITSDVAELSQCVAEAINIGNAPAYFSPAASVDLTDTLLYVYSFNNALQDAWDATIPPNGIYLGDGTNSIGFHMAGNDRRVFNHLDGPTNWQCLLLDISQIPVQDSNSLTYVVGGSVAGLTSASITQIGAYHKANSKALAGGYNIAVDIIRYGNDGVYIIGGSEGDPGVCTNISAADRSTANLAAHGIFREYAPTAFGVQGPLTFGGYSDSYFNDSGVVIVYEDRYVADGKYYFNISGLSTAVNEFRLSDSTVTTAGSNCYSDISSEIDYLEFDSVSFVSLGSTMNFPVDSGVAKTHIVNSCTFSGIGTIDPGSISFTGNVISGSISSIAVLLSKDDGKPGTDNWADLSFISGGTGHAVGIASTGTYTFDNFTYDGYASSDGTTGNEAIFNYSEGEVTLNITGGQTPPSIYNFNTSTTNVVSTATVNINGLPNTVGLANSTEIRVFDRSQIDGNLGFTTTEFAGVGTENHTTSTYSFTVGLGATFDVRIVNLDYVPFFLSNQSADTNPTNIPVSLIPDRVYDDETPPSGE